MDVQETITDAISPDVFTELDEWAKQVYNPKEQELINLFDDLISKCVEAGVLYSSPDTVDKAKDLEKRCHEVVHIIQDLIWNEEKNNGRNPSEETEFKGDLRFVLDTLLVMGIKAGRCRADETISSALSDELEAKCNELKDDILKLVFNVEQMEIV